MIDEKMAKAINQQINAEFYSAHLYLAMETYFHSKNLDGFANWMRVQFQEEHFHAMKLYDYLNERGGTFVCMAIEAPPKQWNQVLDVFEAVYKHEQKVTASINNLVDIAQELKDHATGSFLQWFINEQVEEEANDVAVINKLKLVADAPGGLFMVDKELAARVFTPPAAVN